MGRRHAARPPVAADAARRPATPAPSAAYASGPGPRWEPRTEPIRAAAPDRGQPVLAGVGAAGGRPSGGWEDDGDWDAVQESWRRQHGVETDEARGPERGERRTERQVAGMAQDDAWRDQPDPGGRAASNGGGGSWSTDAPGLHPDERWSTTVPAGGWQLDPAWPGPPATGPGPSTPPGPPPGGGHDEWSVPQADGWPQHSEPGSGDGWAAPAPPEQAWPPPAGEDAWAPPAPTAPADDA